ncbi:tetratricopeptide repeat protein [Pantanalinema rosaneae CENA516]|uniref:tetratricopeptide repeat protein n=1 Tax=Pantanalinema rosaneae TaxID=1620701 RepID=UPI003D6E8DDA
MAASTSFSQSLAHRQHLYRLWNGQGYSMLRDCYYEDALTCFNYAIALDPDQADSWYGRGQALTHLGCYREAFSCFHTALEFEPQHCQAWAWQARMLFYLNQYPAALDSCNQALHLQPHDAETWILRGTVLQNLGQPDAAYASYEQALTLQSRPRLPEAIQHSLQRIWQRFLPFTQRSHPPGRSSEFASTHQSDSNGWATTMTYSAMLISLLMLLQLIQIFQPNHNRLGQSQWQTTAILWIQNQTACQESGRDWQNGICWEPIQ